MAQIAIMIPTNSSMTSWIQGVCEIAGYETHVSADSVSYSIEVDAQMNQMGRRITSEPVVSEVTITRKVDVATNDITHRSLSLSVDVAPWSIYFFRTVGGGPEQEGTYVTRHQLYLTLTLAKPLITSQNISVDETKMTETIKVSASAFDWVYIAYDQDNEPVGQIAYDFDVQFGVDATEDC
jgi:type VI protein secretion system component Hcp